ncbi:MAG: hypothetical protein LBB23_02720, partial [Rickettsiales bacterium]|nr:hypothetical protein [Rickettsiales bacterium]
CGVWSCSVGKADNFIIHYPVRLRFATARHPAPVSGGRKIEWDKKQKESKNDRINKCFFESHTKVERWCC